MKPRNIKLEQNYFKWLKQWKRASSRMEQYEPDALKFLWLQLEKSYYAVGYDFGDDNEPKAKDLFPGLK